MLRNHSATGHSARDIFHLLNNKGLKLEADIRHGVRVKHPQEFIDARQYHGESRIIEQEERLPAASYSLVCQIDGRGVHSFCMCPGYYSSLRNCSGRSSNQWMVAV